jgi:hypothetical protein
MFEEVYALSVASDDALDAGSPSMVQPRGKNEDALCFGKDFLVVIDGAAGLSGIHRMDAVSDVGWMSRRLSELAAAELGSGGSEPTAAILLRCARTIRREMDAAGYPPDGGEYPSACISVVRLIGERLECCALGDVTTLLLQRDGRLVTFMDTTVPKRDAKVVAWAAETAERRGITIAEAMTLASDRLLRNRNERNTAQGYWIFDPTGVGIEHMLTACFPADSITDVALMSDGFFDAYDLFATEALDNRLFHALRTGGAFAIAQKLRAAERADPTLDRYPRLKQSDDATVLYARVVP